MTASSFTLENDFRPLLVSGALGNLTATNAISVALFTASATVNATLTTYTALAAAGGEVANGNGYTTGGDTGNTLVSSGTTDDTLTFNANVIWTATGSGFIADWAVVYEASTSDIIAFAQLSTGGSVTISAGNTLTISDSAPVLTVA